MKSRLLWFALAVSLWFPSLAAEHDAGSDLFSRTAEKNQLRENKLSSYSATRTYQVTSPDGKVRAESRVLVQCDSRAGKTFQILDEHGSHVVAKLVLHPLIEHEKKASKGADKHDSAITPANYNVELKGEDEVDGRSCYVLKVVPRRRERYLFEGTIWIDQQDLAIAKLEGQLAKSPSFWFKRVHILRRYQKIGEFWLPVEDTSTSDVRMFGKHTLTIRYQDYNLGSATLAEHVEDPH